MSPAVGGLKATCPDCGWALKLVDGACEVCADPREPGCWSEPALTLAHRESDLRELGEEHSTPSYPGWGGPICPGCCRPDQACLCRPAPAPAQELTLWLAYLPDGSQWGRPERDAAACLQSAWRELVDSRVEDLAGDFARLRMVRVRVEPVTPAALVALLGREPGLDSVAETSELMGRLRGGGSGEEEGIEEGVAPPPDGDTPDDDSEEEEDDSSSNAGLPDAIRLEELLEELAPAARSYHPGLSLEGRLAEALILCRAEAADLRQQVTYAERCYREASRAAGSGEEVDQSTLAGALADLALGQQEAREETTALLARLRRVLGLSS